MTLRSTAPPIDVEMSDESGDEWGRPFGESSVHGHGRKHPHIFEEEEDEVAAPHSQVDQNLAYSSSIQPSERYIVPPPTSTTPHPESRLTEDEAMEELLRRLHNHRSCRMNGYGSRKILVRY